MCTVTFVPVNGNFFITSNRDEKLSRGRAMPPAVDRLSNKNIIYPKDPDASGTWIAVMENGNAAVLLNGAFEKHIPSPPYRKSRGLIFLEILAHEEPVQSFNLLDLSNIEPFTIIIFQNLCLYECRWTGEQKFCQQLRNDRPYIWSSVTLYEKEMIRKREHWFGVILDNMPYPTQTNIMDFHRFGGDVDLENRLVMRRGNEYGTVSITSIHLTPDRGSMKYLDLSNNLLSEKKIQFVTTLETA